MCIEELPAGEGHQPHGYALACQLLPCLHNQCHLGAARHQDELWAALAQIGQDVCPFSKARRRGVMGAIQCGQILACEHKRSGLVAVFQRNFPGLPYLIGIRRPDRNQLRNGT